LEPTFIGNIKTVCRKLPKPLALRVKFLKVGLKISNWTIFRLASFMFTLSKKTGLSQIYTNHSIRATGATILGRNCSMTQIMAVTGHKSALSVAVVDL
jgi:hypothetical protein